ncbi:MFS transporter [Streptomyces litchfieldiae]|uniref:MFS transporter n=1 Tax=Streptomyces litchfieldiae TaxID=3075543 RepID=A0ABU2MJT6_9ACTN|nr:MFS transporter [Streptomyces sp. DSM 44938]MDT0341800.1 MFS transporter [Streptomyces sp. DSM 44938]
MRTYRELFAVPEFTPLFTASGLGITAGTIEGLALGTLVFEATGSPLLSALSMFGASFSQVLGATLLMAVADRRRPRALLTAGPSLLALGVALLAVPGLPVAVTLLIILATGLVNSVAGGARWGLLLRLLPEGGYVLGRSLFGMAGGLTQIGGFAAGGVLIAFLSPRGALLVAAGLFLAAAAVTRLGLTDRPPAGTGGVSARDTWRVNRELWGTRERRRLYLALWVPNGLVVGCEALFVPYAPDAAGALFLAAALGMLLGDVTMARLVPPRLRPRLITPMRLLLAAPFLLFALPGGPPLPLAAVLALVACTGYSASLLLQEQLVARTPEDMRGQALGLQSAGTMTFQAVGATLAGGVAHWVAPGPAMGVMAAASLLVSLALTPGLVRLARTPPTPDPARSSSAPRPAS